MSQKTTLREWLFAQHMPPEVREDVEKLFALPAEWRTTPIPPLNERPDYPVDTTRWARLAAKNIHYCADELEAILGK